MPSISFDHVALRVRDRATSLVELQEHLDVQVLQHTDQLTLLGASADHGKLTLLDAQEGVEPEPGRLVSLVFAESPGRGTPLPTVLRSGIVVTFAPIDELGSAWSDTPRHALIGVTLRASDPPLLAAQLEAEHGMHVESVSPDHAVIEVGDRPSDGLLTFTREAWRGDDARAMLDHVGMRVADASARRSQALAAQLDVVRWVEGPHSRAVFVAGPDGLLLEYVELTAPLVPA